MNTSNGFTLIELLIVIAIILILTVVLLPNLLNARHAANNSAALSLAKNMATVAETQRAGDASGATSYQVATNCVSVLVTTLPNDIQSCQVRQDGNGSYTLVKSSTGDYFLFDGNAVKGPLTSAPTTW